MLPMCLAKSIEPISLPENKWGFGLGFKPTQKDRAEAKETMKERRIANYVVLR